MVYLESASRDCVMAVCVFLLVLMISSTVGCNRKTASDYLAAGDEAMQGTRLAAAESDYQRAAQAAPLDARPHLALGSLYLFEHKPSPATSELMKTLELEPGNAKAHALLASAYTAQSDLGSAEGQGRAAVALAPAQAEYRMALGTTLQSEQKLGAAEAEYRTAVGLEPRNAHAHLALAALLNVEPNRQGEAQAEYAEVKALDPGLVSATVATESSLGSGLTPPSAAPVVPEVAIRPSNKRFLLTHDSPVYESMSDKARVVAQVHQRRYVRVTGLSAQWLRIQLRDGTIGFIPASAAE